MLDWRTAAIWIATSACGGLSVAGLSDGPAALTAQAVGGIDVPGFPPSEPDHDETPPARIAGGRKVTVRRSADSLFYLTAKLNGVPVRFVVDTGATHVVLTNEDAERAGVVADGPAATIATSGGGAPANWTRVKRLKVATRDIDRVDALVTRDGLRVSLLGQSALARLGSIRMDGETLTIDES